MSAARAECLLLGQPGVGKTLLAVGLARAMGYRELRVSGPGAGGAVACRTWSIADARRALVGKGSPGSRSLQWIETGGPEGAPGWPGVVFVDAPGLPAAASDDPDLREAAAEVLRLFPRALLVLHVVDAASFREPSEIDVALARLGRHLGPRYLILANKADRPAARDGLRRLRLKFAGLELVRVSALRGTGLPGLARRLKRLLARGAML